MPALVEDSWVNDQAHTAPVSQITNTTIAIDATYYIQTFLDNQTIHEPLLPALGGLVGIQAHIEADLDRWKGANVIPFFIFNGQTIVGQDDVSTRRGKRANTLTDEAWSLYFEGKADDAVSAFGTCAGAFNVRSLYPMLQSILRKRKLHFLVPPFNASAQLAYFEISDSEQCHAVMGSQELLLYPIKETIIRSIDWDAQTVTFISKEQIIKNLSVSEQMFIDALLMTGTSFLPTFPPLEDTNITSRQPFNIMDAVNMLRTSDKSIANACASFSDILQSKDPEWLDKYRKSRMAIEHFIYVTDDGEVKVHKFDTLTSDNYAYLGFQLPAELFHYLNTGLLGPRTLSWITHGQINILPTLDGVKSDEYKKLISNQLIPVREATLSLIIPRLNRGIQYNNTFMKVWFDDSFSYKVNYRNPDTSPTQRAHTWFVKENAIKEHFPDAKQGSIIFEVRALKNNAFAESTVAKEKIKGIDSTDLVLSTAIWRFLHLRGYANDAHKLTTWGRALAASAEAIEKKYGKATPVPGLYEALIVAFELIRFDLLNTRNQHPELSGLPMNGTEDDKASLLLISRCAILLKLRHAINGYTGPLSKNSLAFRSLSSAVREADRDLIEALVASMLLYAQGKKERQDYLEIGQRLPFQGDNDVALAIAIKTLLDDISPSDAPEVIKTKKAEFPGKYVPFATHFFEDFDIACEFFLAVRAGVKELGDDEISPRDKEAWEKAVTYLAARR